jgi:hypothetical protein
MSQTYTNFVWKADSRYCKGFAIKYVFSYFFECSKMLKYLKKIQLFLSFVQIVSDFCSQSFC